MIRTIKKYVVQIEEQFYHNYEDIMDIMDTDFDKDVRYRNFNSMEEAIKFIQEDIYDYMNDEFVSIFGVVNLNETKTNSIGTEVRQICKLKYDSEAYDRQFCERTYSIYVGERKVGLGGIPLSRILRKL